MNKSDSQHDAQPDAGLDDQIHQLLQPAAGPRHSI